MSKDVNGKLQFHILLQNVLYISTFLAYAIPFWTRTVKFHKNKFFIITPTDFIFICQICSFNIIQATFDEESTFLLTLAL